jgi:hypothetical protein
MIPRLQNYGTRIFAVCFNFKGRHLEASIKQVNRINLLCNTNLNLKICEKKIATFLFYLPKEKFPVLIYLGLRMTVMLGIIISSDIFYSHELCGLGQ